MLIRPNGSGGVAMTKIRRCMANVVMGTQAVLQCLLLVCLYGWLIVWLVPRLRLQVRLKAVQLKFFAVYPPWSACLSTANRSELQTSQNMCCLCWCSIYSCNVIISISPADLDKPCTERGGPGRHSATLQVMAFRCCVSDPHTESSGSARNTTTTLDGRYGGENEVERSFGRHRARGAPRHCTGLYAEHIEYILYSRNHIVNARIIRFANRISTIWLD